MFLRQTAIFDDVAHSCFKRNSQVLYPRASFSIFVCGMNGVINKLIEEYHKDMLQVVKCRTTQCVYFVSVCNRSRCYFRECCHSLSFVIVWDDAINELGGMGLLSQWWISDAYVGISIKCDLTWKRVGNWRQQPEGLSGVTNIGRLLLPYSLVMCLCATLVNNRFTCRWVIQTA